MTKMRIVLAGFFCGKDSGAGERARPGGKKRLPKSEFSTHASTPRTRPVLKKSVEYPYPAHRSVNSRQMRMNRGTPTIATTRKTLLRFSSGRSWRGLFRTVVAEGCRSGARLANGQF